MIGSLEAEDLREAGIGAFFRPRDLAPLGISHRRLQGLVSRGVVESFGVRRKGADMLIHRLKVPGLLSFGPNGVDLPMEPLNVLIGPNGSGKSNFLEVMACFGRHLGALRNRFHDGQTEMRRLDKDDLERWLKEYTLGNLWSSGKLGGNRW